MATHHGPRVERYKRDRWGDKSKKGEATPMKGYSVPEPQAGHLIVATAKHLGLPTPWIGTFL